MRCMSRTPIFRTVIGIAALYKVYSRLVFLRSNLILVQAAARVESESSPTSISIISTTGMGVIV